MSILQKTSLLAVQSLIDGVCKVVGVEVVSSASSAAIGFFVQRFTDHSLKLTGALENANGNAWRAVEIALAGDTWWDRVKGTLARGEDQALANHVRAFLESTPLAGLPGHGPEFRMQCLAQLRAARQQGLLSTSVRLDLLAQEAGDFARFSAPDELLRAEQATLDALAQDVEQSGFGTLGQFLRLRPACGTSILTLAVRYFFRREIESDAALFQGLAFAKLERLETNQERGFAGLSTLIVTHGARLDQLLGDLGTVVRQTHGDVKEIKAALDRQSQQLQAVSQVMLRAVVQPSPESDVSPQKEQYVRLDMLNTLLKTPHRDLQTIWPIHESLIAKDPRFYVQLAAWYYDKGEVRDHKEMFIVALLLSSFTGHRDVGLAMLAKLPPYQLARVVDFIHGRKETRRRVIVATETRAKSKKLVERTEIVRDVVGEFGLFRNVPRSVKTEVERYLREREASPDWFDSTVLVARKALKRLYAVLHIKPGPRAQQILFDDKPPADSRIAGLKALANCDSPDLQAQAIIANKIPFRIAVSVLGEITPSVLEALIERMSPQELINNLQTLQRHGAMSNPDLKAMIDLKLEEAKSYGRASTFKAEKALETATLTTEMKAKLEDITDTQIKARGSIRRPTALLVDKSGSMDQAIDLGKRIAAMISTICAQELFVYAFDTMAYAIQPKGRDWVAWKQAFAGITATGQTSVGVALEVMRRKNQRVEQIIVVTDEEEYDPPYFVDSYRKYCQALGVEPTICFVKVDGSSTRLEDQCKRAGIKPTTFEFKGDYYSLPNLVALIEPPSELDLLMEIMDYPLPERKVVVL